jgi:hypothetical protein
MKKSELRQLIREEVRNVSQKRPMKEGVLTIAAGVILGLIGLKILKSIAVKVVGGVAANVTLSPDKLKRVLDGIEKHTIQKTQGMLGSDFLEMHEVLEDIKSKIDNGEITTIKGIQDVFKELSGESD